MESAGQSQATVTRSSATVYWKFGPNLNSPDDAENWACIQRLYPKHRWEQFIIGGDGGVGMRGQDAQYLAGLLKKVTNSRKAVEELNFFVTLIPENIRNASFENADQGLLPRMHLHPDGATWNPRIAVFCASHGWPTFGITLTSEFRLSIRGYYNSLMHQHGGWIDDPNLQCTYNLCHVLHELEPTVFTEIPYADEIKNCVGPRLEPRKQQGQVATQQEGLLEVGSTNPATPYDPIRDIQQQ